MASYHTRRARGIAQTTLRPNWDAALGPLNSAVPFVAKWACTTTVTPKNPIGVPSPPFGFVNGVNSQFPICGGTNNLKTLSNSALFGGLGSFINPQQIVAGQESITEAGLAIAVDQNGWGQEGVAGVASSLFTNAAGFPDIVPGSESGANCNGSASQNSSSNGTFVGAPKCAVSSSNSATTGGFEPGLSGPHVYIVGNTANRNFVNSLVFNASCTLAPFVSSTAVPALCPVPEVWGNGVTLAGTLPGGPTFLGPICDPLQQLAPGQAGYNPATGPGVCPAGGERLGDLRVKLATGLVNSGQTQGWLASFQFPAVTQDIVQPPLTTSPTTVTTLNPPTIPNYIVLQPPTCPPQGTGGTGCIEGEVVTPVNTPGSITTASPAPPAALGCAFTGGVFNSVTCPTPYIGSWNAVAVDSDQQVYVLGQIGMSPALVDGVATAGLFGTGPPDRLALEFERIGPYANTPPGNSFLPNFCPGPANAPCAYPENLFPVSGAGFGSTTLLVDAATGVGGGAGSIFGSSFGQILPGAPPFPNPNAPGGLGNGIAVNPTREAFFVGTSTVVTAPGVIPVFVTANTSTLSVDYITIVTALTGYSSLPTCTITGGGGSGATCSFAAGQAAGDVQLVSGQIRSGPLCTAVAPPASHGCGAGPGVALFSCPSCVTAGGTNYTTAPTVTLTPTPPTSGALNYLTAVSTAPAVPPVPATEGSFAGFGGVNAGENCTLGADGINPPSSANPCSGTGPEDVIYGAVQFFDAIATPTVVNFTATVNNFSSITAPDGLTGSAAVATINYSNWQALPLNIPPGCIVTPHVPIGRDGVNPDFVLTAIPGTASFTVSVNSTAAVLGPVAIPGVSTSLVTFTKGDQCAGLGGAGTLDSWDPLTLTLTVSAPLNLSPENTFQITSKLASGVVDQYFAGGTQIVANQFLTFGVDVSTANAGGPINFTAQIVGGQNWSGSVTNSVVVPLPTDIIYEAGGVGSAGGTVRVPVAVNTLVLAGLPIGTYTAYIVFTASPETPDLPTAGSFNCGIAANVPVGSGTTSPACIPIVITITPGQVANSGFLVFGSSTSSQQTQVQISNPTSAAFNFTAGYTATPVFGTALPAAYVSLSGTATIAPIPATLGATVTGTVPAGGVFSLPVNVNPNPGGGLPLLPTGVYSGQILFSTNGQASGATPQTTVPLIVYVGPHAGEDLPSGNGLGLMLPVNVPPIGTGGSQGTGTGCPATAPASCAGGYPLTLSVPSGVGPAGFDQIPNPTLLEVTGLNNASTTAFSVGAPSFTVTSPASTSSSFVTFTNPGAGFGGTPGTCGSTYASLSALPNSPLGPSCAWGLWIDATNLNSTTTTAQAACGGGLGVSGTITFSPASGSFPFAPLVVPLTICVTDAPALILDVPNTFPNPTYGPSAFTGLNSPQTEPSNLIPGFPQSVVSMILAESNNVTVNATAAPINLLASQGNSTPVCQILSLETNGGVVNNVTIAPITSPFLSIQSLATLGTAGAVFLGPGLVSGAPNTLQWNSGGASFFNFTGGITGLGGSLSLPASPPFAAGPVTITPSVQTFAICGNTDEVGNATGIFSGTVTINGAGVGSITIPVNLIVGNGSPSTGGSGGSLINVSEIGVFRSGAPFGTGPQPAGFVLNSESSNQLGGAYNFPQASADGKVLLAPFGLPGDIPVAGNWNGTGAVTIGVFRNGQWILDLNNNGVFDGVFGGDGVFIFGQAGDQPVVGDWNGDGRSKFGIFRPSTGQFILDFQGHMTFDASAVLYSFGLSGDIPVAGNWSGGKADFIGVFRPSTGQWILDTAGNGVFSASSAIYNFGLSCSSPGPTCDQPVVGNWGNGTPVIKRIGVFRPSTGQWILSNPTNGNWVPTDPVFQFGEAGDSAIVGFWTLP